MHSNINSNIKQGSNGESNRQGNINTSRVPHGRPVKQTNKQTNIEDQKLDTRLLSGVKFEQTEQSKAS